MTWRPLRPSWTLMLLRWQRSMLLPGLPASRCPLSLIFAQYAQLAVQRQPGKRAYVSCIMLHWERHGTTASLQTIALPRESAHASCLCTEVSSSCRPAVLTMRMRRMAKLRKQQETKQDRAHLAQTWQLWKACCPAWRSAMQTPSQLRLQLRLRVQRSLTRQQPLKQ